MLLDQFQLQLSRRGLKVSQKKLIDQSIRYALSHQEDFITGLRKKNEDNTKKMTKKLLVHAKKYDLGENWLEEIDTTL